HLRTQCHLVQCRGYTATGRVFETVDAITCCREERGYQRVEGCGIALDVGFDFECLTGKHNGDAVIPNRTAQQHPISCLQLCLTEPQVGPNEAHASRVDEDTISLAALHYFGISGHYGDSCLSRCCRHRCDDTAQVSDGKSFFQDKASREIERLR